MGGIFIMFKKIWKLVVIFLCGYLIIEWISITRPFVLSDFFIGLVINPLEFFAASLALFIGVLFNGGLIREIIQQTSKAWRKRNKWSLALFWEYSSLFFIFCVLFQLGWELTFVFLCLSILYGMISVEL